jgi:hypothetical protein
MNFRKKGVTPLRKTSHRYVYFLHFLREEKRFGQIFFYHCEAREKLYKNDPYDILFGNQLSREITA